MITVIPEGGLCNRLRVVASAWLLAQQAQRPMRVLWYRTPDFNARFDSLFTAHALPFIVSERRAWRRSARALWRVREQVARAFGHVVLGPAQTEPGALDVLAVVQRVRQRSALIRTNSRLLYKRDMYRYFELTPTLARRLQPLRERLVQSVGVHVRRTDNVQAQRESTLERFVELMQAEVAQDPAVQFFVATDSGEVLAALRARFGDRIWEHAKVTLARDDPSGLADAVIDLFALSECRKLIGSYWSSFTDTAAELREIECVIARSQS